MMAVMVSRSKRCYRSRDWPFDRYPFPFIRKGPTRSREGPTVLTATAGSVSGVASTCSASDAARPGMDKAELEIGFGDFEHLAASLFGPDSPQLGTRPQQTTSFAYSCSVTLTVWRRISHRALQSGQRACAAQSPRRHGSGEHRCMRR